MILSYDMIYNIHDIIQDDIDLYIFFTNLSDSFSETRKRWKLSADTLLASPCNLDMCVC